VEDAADTKKDDIVIDSEDIVDKQTSMDVATVIDDNEMDFDL